MGPKRPEKEGLRRKTDDWQSAVAGRRRSSPVSFCGLFERSRWAHNSWHPTWGQEASGGGKKLEFVDGVGTGLSTIVAEKLLRPFGKVTLGAQQLAPNVGPKRPDEGRIKKKTHGRPPTDTGGAVAVVGVRRRKHHRQPLRWTKDLLRGMIIEKVKDTLAHRHGLGFGCTIVEPS